MTTQRSLSVAAKLYITAVCVAGGLVILSASVEIYQAPIGWSWVLLALLTLVSGTATVKLPSVPATISISETFVFTAVLLFGAAAGVLTVALDALVISIWLAWRGHPLYRLAFNVAALPLALWLGASVYYGLGDVPPLYLTPQSVNITQLLIPLIFFTITYFILNSWLIAIAISLEDGVSPFSIWKNNLAWLSLNYFGGASIAALLITYTRDIDYAYLAFALPLLAIIYITFTMSLGRVADANRHLTQLNSLYLSTIETLAMAIDAKDQITHGHIRRVQAFAVSLAKELGVSDDAQIKAIEAASLLHDMGKLAVPEYILHKPGPLTPAEFEKMKLHASVGADILSAIDFPYPVVPIVRHHHENWDGSGYPDRIKGSEIPIGARILAVVDCFDALTSDRPYRPRLTDSQAIRILQERRGTMYDPLIVDAFVQLHGRFVESEKMSAANPFAAISTAPRATGIGLEDISASTEESRIVYELTRDLSARGTISEIVQVLSRHLRRLMPVTTIVIYRYNGDTDDLVVEGVDGEHAPHLTGIRITRGQRLSGWVAANRQTIINSDPTLDFGDTVRSLTPRLTSCLSSPLVAGDRLVGVLSLYSTQSLAYLEDHGRVIAPVAEVVARAIEHGASLKQPGQNVRPALNMLDHVPAENLFATLKESYSNISVFLLDVRPHTEDPSSVGGNKSQSTAFYRMCIGQALGPSDSLIELRSGRLLVLIPHESTHDGADRIKRLEHLISTLKIDSSGLPEHQVMFGWAACPTDGNQLRALLHRAEERAKLGRGGQPSAIH
jgi:putative nucleotidyltransferase with HDIG domain